MQRTLFSWFERVFGPDAPRVRMEDVAAASPTAVEATVAWGPVSKEVATLAGALVPTSSVLLVPNIPQTLKDEVLALIPSGAWTVAGESPSALAARLAKLSFFEDAHVLKGGGAGKSRVRLLATKYGQPRRKGWSVQVQPPRRLPDGTLAADYLNYTAYGRLAEDWEADQMPTPIWHLDLLCWSAARSFLSDYCRQSPPTACQLIMYHALFGGAMGRHRDNFNSMQLGQVVCGEKQVQDLVDGSHHGGDANSQVVGSDVLIYTLEGSTAMQFVLSFPPPGNPLVGSIKAYEVHPSLCVPLSGGTLLVFKAIDDLFFCHESFFLSTADGTECRVALVFRWLQSVRSFNIVTKKIVLTEELQERQRSRKKAKVAKAARDRASLLAYTR